MSTLSLLLALFAVDSLAILSPGPGLLLVAQTAIEHRRRHALTVALGMAAAGLLWAGVAVSGLVALFALVPSLQSAIRVAGAAYLVYIGVRVWRNAGAQTDGAIVQAAQPAMHKAFVRGFVTSLLNPKALAYFASIFVLFVPADASPSLRAGAVAIVVADGMLWYGLIALLFSTAAVRNKYLALRRPIDRACGALMTLFGLRLAM
jgi:threonine efflux protein